MSRLRMTLEVARWEFFRFFKWKDQVVSLLLLLVVGGGWWGVRELAARRGGTPEVAVLHPELLPFELPPDSRVRIVPAGGRSETALRDLVGAGKLGGLLILRSVDEAELVVAKEPRWLNELEPVLSAARQRARLAALNLAPGDLAGALAPFSVRVSVHEKGRPPTSLGDKILAAVLVGLMMLGVFLGLSFFLVGVTGEKQLRVTEQVVAAISPQTWMDGKLLGITAMTLATLANYCLSTVLLLVAGQALGLGLPKLPAAAADPGLVVAFVVLALLGLLFWNAFFAAVSATINDPNTSSRTAMLFLPLIPVLCAFLALKDPDTRFLQVLSLLPGTSSAVLPARLVLTDVAWWEVPVAVLLLLAAVALFRRAAGKVFGLAMLMYGKEPTWREVWRWAREA